MQKEPRLEVDDVWRKNHGLRFKCFHSMHAEVY
jgi:hypothetical protein